ncbi:MAG: iron-sulfur cluster assembly scaffold protein [Candidatus Niyogibacteria bacterium]|nr:MAG: iron-sulfur cluster assembly scaffold protein [Candidatus Niyogibacteria bacterium]
MNNSNKNFLMTPDKGFSNGIYQELIMEHARNPRNVGVIYGTKKISAKNPFCGDEAEIFLKIKNGKIADIKYQIQGCILSRAALSIFSEHIKGRPISLIKKIKNEDIFKMVGGTPSPSRQNCVLFGLEAVKLALERGGI